MNDRKELPVVYGLKTDDIELHIEPRAEFTQDCRVYMTLLSYGQARYRVQGIIVNAYDDPRSGNRRFILEVDMSTAERV